MTAVLDVSDAINLFTGGGVPQIINRWRADRRQGAAPTAPVIGRITDTARWDSQPGSMSGTIPTTSVVLTNATAGGLGQDAVAAGKTLFLVAATLICNAVGSAVVYDRCVESGGLLATTVGASATNLPTAALTRHTDGVGVEPWLNIYTLIGTTGTTVACSYTNTTPTSGRTSPLVVWGGTGVRELDRLQPLPLASGDRGCRAVASVSGTASTGTAGNYGVTLAYPIVTIACPFPGIAGGYRSILDTAGPFALGQDSDALITEAWFAGAVTVPWFQGQYLFVEK